MFDDIDYDLDYDTDSSTIMSGEIDVTRESFLETSYDPKAWNELFGDELTVLWSCMELTDDNGIAEYNYISDITIKIRSPLMGAWITKPHPDLESFLLEQAELDFKLMNM